MAIVIRRQHVSAYSLVVIPALVFSNLATPAQAAVVTLVATTNTGQGGTWGPAYSPDPSGITYWPSKDRLVVSDAEVEEIPAIWNNSHTNVIEATRDGIRGATYDITSFNNEPAGIDIEIANDCNWFISNDSKKTVWDVDLGPDRTLGTKDDKRRPFLTSGFGNGDPEGLTLANTPAGRLLITVDGAGSRIYFTEPGPNGIFEASDATTFCDVASIGVGDPEGVDYDEVTGNLWVVDRRNKILNEITMSCALVQAIDLRALAGAVFPGDVTLAPASDNSGVPHLYVVDRGIDNNVNPNENDGKIYELSVSSSAPPPTTNLLANGGFETANILGQPTNWSTDLRFTQSAAVVHGESFAGQFAAIDNLNVTINQVVKNLTAGTTYDVVSWINIPTTDDAFSFTVDVRWRDTSKTVINTQSVKVYTDDNAGAWEQSMVSLTAPAGTTNAQIRMVAKSLNGAIYVDDFVFKAQ